jgi:hypothetical protein
MALVPPAAATAIRAVEHAVVCHKNLRYLWRRSPAADGAGANQRGALGIKVTAHFKLRVVRHQTQLARGVQPLWYDNACHARPPSKNTLVYIIIHCADTPVNTKVNKSFTKRENRVHLCRG